MYLIHAFDYQDDMQIRVFNYNTLERVHQFEAHSDYIRSIAVHPNQPFILSSSGESGRNSVCVLGLICMTHTVFITLWKTVDYSTE